MNEAIARLRMFAGPNGSGKTTVKTNLGKPASWFGIYINPDDLERSIRETGFLPLAPYELTTTSAEVRGHFASSAFLQSRNLHSNLDTINIQRVKNRVLEGGHDVPETKIVERYHRSLALLQHAIRASNRAFLFDTSEEDPWYFAEITDGSLIELKSDEIPRWFQPIWDVVSAET